MLVNIVDSFVRKKLTYLLVNNYESTYEKLLSYNCFSIRNQNIHCLATGIYKVERFQKKNYFKDQYTVAYISL